jgi:zinc transport system substrate-binding protein
MNFLKKAIIFVIAPLLLSFSAKADIKVVTTIKPLHSLISSVMEGVGEPSLIIEGTSNPHTFVFKPSHAQMLEEADIVFWIGEDLEAFMEKPLDSLADNATKISFMELSSIEKLKFREENIFDDHDDHGHDDHDGHEDEHEGHDDHDDDGHKEDDHDDHGHDDHDGHEDEHEGHDDHGHNDHDGHNHGEFDAHIWLDPSNAIKMVLEISHELSEADPDNAAKYEQNENKTIASLNNLIDEINSSIPKDASYVVFHDAYQYFENRFGVSSAGALTLNPDVLPGAKQIDAIQDLIQDENIKCIFSEPQYNPKIIETLAADMKISTGIMDPLGAFIEQGPEMYQNLILDIANSLKDCGK